MKDLDIQLAHIERAAEAIDPVFLRTPQYVDDQLCAALQRRVLVKVETANPIRSFKGRGADFAITRVPSQQRVVCTSTGNFGQAIAYAGRRRQIPVEVFVPAGANPVKLSRMRLFGATVHEGGRDSAEAAEVARHYAADRPECVFLEDGKDPAIAEGAGTIAVELMDAGPHDTLVVPVGDGALIAGMGLWMKAHAPSTRIVGVCASGAPSMMLSWRAGKPISTERSETIAEGIEVRDPVPESIVRLCALVDDMVIVDDSDLLAAMQLAIRTLGLVLEPSGAAGLAAIQRHNLAGERIATVLTGSNARSEHLQGSLARSASVVPEPQSGPVRQESAT